ncbi:unnamed protein product [Urochloa decumbens]|uniref:SHSP domain-containing protein n=1 Tax=Urochloa decumbens TaxID=240449 RepID=A0ABC8W5H9_9POAL
MASGRQAAKPQQAAEEEFDPKYEWQENATNFILRLHLSGFRKEDFRVQVDGTGRLTVRGQRADAGANAKHSRFNKVFQLPASSDLDGITGRFDAGVLTLTVPKKVVDDAKPKPKEDATKAATPPPPPQEQGKQPKEDEAKKPQPERKEAAEVATANKTKEDAKPKEDDKKPPAAEQQVDAKRGKPEQEQRTPAPPPATVREEEAKAKAEPAGTPPATVRKEEVKPKPGAAAPPAAAAEKQQDAPKPAQADSERKAVDPESLAAVTARRRAEEEKAKAAAAAEEEAERQRPRRGLKERVQEELEGLAGSEWAESVVDTVKKNKEVIAVAVAAFSLGLFASRIFSRN